MSLKSQVKSRLSPLYVAEHEHTVGRKALRAMQEPTVLEPIANLREFQHVWRVKARIEARKAKAARRAAWVAYHTRKPFPAPNMTEVLVAVATKKGNDTLLMLDNGQMLSVRRYTQGGRVQNPDLERKVTGYIVKQRSAGREVIGAFPAPQGSRRGSQ